MKNLPSATERTLNWTISFTNKMDACVSGTEIGGSMTQGVHWALIKSHTSYRRMVRKLEKKSCHITYLEKCCCEGTVVGKKACVCVARSPGGNEWPGANLPPTWAAEHERHEPRRHRRQRQRERYSIYNSATSCTLIYRSRVSTLTHLKCNILSLVNILW